MRIRNFVHHQGLWHYSDEHVGKNCSRNHNDSADAVDGKIDSVRLSAAAITDRIPYSRVRLTAASKHDSTVTQPLSTAQDAWQQEVTMMGQLQSRPTSESVAAQTIRARG